MRSSDLWIACVAALVACGPVVPRGGVSLPATATPSTRLPEPRELVPSDLDLVIRLDLGALRASLGDRPTDELLRSALEASRLDEA
ncbi:MAG: hypothetical protein FJ096_23075, partial [Deltaproteobacteria bacterium]|nr:hypothetical protein [Deltaproteobacteria bacterium]